MPSSCFDLAELDDEKVLERLFLLLSADRLLGGATEALLRQHRERRTRTSPANSIRSYKKLFAASSSPF